MSIKILTDSACDMPAEELEKYDIELMPLYVIEGEKTYLDGIEITPGMLYSKMRRGVPDSLCGFCKAVHRAGRGVDAFHVSQLFERSVWNLSGGNAGEAGCAGKIPRRGY